ncbi:MAG: MBL fold metallo-hydrolase [bacterium]
MLLSILCDDRPAEGFDSEHGLSYLIEGSKPLLFDTGQSDVFLKNARKLNLDIDSTRTIALSHGHYDHVGGLEFLADKKIICHPQALDMHFKSNGSSIGSTENIYALKSRFDITSTKKPLNITERIVFLGEIPRTVQFEHPGSDFTDRHGNISYMPDDTGLAVIGDRSISIISGCAHSGICNIIEYAKEVTGIRTIDTVIGGFHLRECDLKTEKTMQYLKNEDIKRIMPAHCTSDSVIEYFKKELKSYSVRAGMQIEI